MCLVARSRPLEDDNDDCRSLIASSTYTHTLISDEGLGESIDKGERGLPSQMGDGWRQGPRLQRERPLATVASRAAAATSQGAPPLELRAPRTTRQHHSSLNRSIKVGPR